MSPDVNVCVYCIGLISHVNTVPVWVPAHWASKVNFILACMKYYQPCKDNVISILNQADRVCYQLQMWLR